MVTLGVSPVTITFFMLVVSTGDLRRMVLQTRLHDEHLACAHA